VLGGEVVRLALRLVVDDEVDVALAVERTFFERCSATLRKPSFSNTGSSASGVGDANSTNSNPINPIGFSNRSAMATLLRHPL
jgi:hypothetical protein